MTFKPGQSGNPKGRAKGSMNRRTQLAKLFESHAEKLIDKVIELALNGDVIALRICIERLLPKVIREPIEISVPSRIHKEDLPEIKNLLLQEVLNGRINPNEA